jgi:hypothetical protein
VKRSTRALPATAPLSFAPAIAEQIDGIVDLGQSWESGGVTEPHYDILTLDAISATASDAHAEKRRAENAFVLENDGNRLPPSVKAALNADASPTQRGGGLALALCSCGGRCECGSG